MKKRYLGPNFILFIALFSSASQISYENTELHDLLRQTELSQVSILVAIFNGVSVNAQNIRGNNPLHYLLQDFELKNVDSVKFFLDLLIKYGADINTTNDQNETPIGCLYYPMLAHDRDEQEYQKIFTVVQYILDKDGCFSIDSLCHGRKTLLELACMVGDDELVGLLVKRLKKDAFIKHKEQGRSLDSLLVNSNEEEILSILNNLYDQNMEDLLNRVDDDDLVTEELLERDFLANLIINNGLSSVLNNKHGSGLYEFFAKSGNDKMKKLLSPVTTRKNKNNIALRVQWREIDW